MNSFPLDKISDEKILELWVILEKQNNKKYTFDEVCEVAQELVNLHLHLARMRAGQSMSR